MTSLKSKLVEKQFALSHKSHRIISNSQTIFINLPFPSTLNMFPYLAQEIKIQNFYVHF